jgi:hypothetical protein
LVVEVGAAGSAVRPGFNRETLAAAVEVLCVHQERPMIPHGVETSSGASQSTCAGASTARPGS